MCPYWFQIAFDHLKATERAHKKLMSAKDGKDANLIGTYLKKESSSGMQTIVASGIAIDAYYASLKEYVNIPEATLAAWRNKPTARYKQIAETMRVGLHLTKDGAKSLRDVLKQNRAFPNRSGSVRP